MIIPKHISYILETINNAGFEAYVVGGCVRDTLLNITPNDWDVSSSATPEQVTNLFNCKHTVFQSGVKHGTVTVVLPEGNIEITTFRTDGEYLDRRRPSSVSFTRNIKEDLARRDFTINAMAYSDKTGIIDLFDGQKALKHSILACVGNPEKRFNEDALRIIRALRFASVYKLSIDAKTSDAIHNFKDLLNDISVERICVELQKAILSPGFCNVFSIYNDVLSVIFPSMGYDKIVVNEFINYTKNIDALPKDPVIRLSYLFYWAKITLNSEGKHYCDLCRKCITRLKVDKKTINKITTIAILQTSPSPTSLIDVRWMVNKYGYTNIIDFISVSKYIPEYNTELLQKYLNEIRDKRLCCSLKELAISGNDLISNNISSGTEIGRVLNNALKYVIEEKLDNDKKTLLNFIINNN